MERCFCAHFFPSQIAPKFGFLVMKHKKGRKHKHGGKFMQQNWQMAILNSRQSTNFKSFLLIHHVFFQQNKHLLLNKLVCRSKDEQDTAIRFSCHDSEFSSGSGIETEYCTEPTSVCYEKGEEPNLAVLKRRRRATLNLKKFQNFHSCLAIFATTTIAQNVMVLTSIQKNAVFWFAKLCIDMRLGRNY